MKKLIYILLLLVLSVTPIIAENPTIDYTSTSINTYKEWDCIYIFSLDGKLIRKANNTSIIETEGIQSGYYIIVMVKGKEIIRYTIKL